MIQKYKLLCYFTLITFSIIFAPSTKAKTSSAKAADLLRDYKENNRMAPMILEDLMRDKPLYEKLLTNTQRSPASILKLIESSSSTAVASISYLLKHYDQFIIGYYEGDLFCLVNIESAMNQIEATGPSPDAWVIRQDYFNDVISRSYEMLPWCSEVCNPQFEKVYKSIVTAERLYKKPEYKKKLLGLRARLANEFKKYLDSDTKDFEKDDQHNAMIATVQSWIKRLEKIKP